MRSLAAAILLIEATPAAAQQVDVTLATQQDGTRTLAHEITVPAPVSDVWTALTTAEGWRTWAVPIVREIAGSSDRFESGYDPSALPGAPSSIEQVWIERREPNTAAFRTTRAPEGFPHADAYYRVVSRFTLTPLGDVDTRVRLEGSGYPAGSAGDALLTFFREGNRSTLQQLHARFATGPINWTASRGVPDKK